MSTTVDPRHDLEVFRPEDEERIRRLNAFRREVLTLLEVDATMERYGEASGEPEEELCCPVDYDRSMLAHIPAEILEIDYGCGDPTGFAEEGQTVLDLGSGSGKHCFMMAKKVGPNGRVIGVDKTPKMLDRARAATPTVMSNLGYGETSNVTFRHGHIENLRVDKDRLLAELGERSVASYDDLETFEAAVTTTPMIADESVDLVVSNCVLNLVDDRRKDQLFRELFRVVRRGGSVAISDIVAEKPVPQEMKDDAKLWSGCISGAYERSAFVRAFDRAGFYGMTEVKSFFWKRVGGINFFSVTIRAWKGKQGPCYETYRSALYKGPFRRVADDDNHVFERGAWTPVCEKTANILSSSPYAASFEVSPALEDPAKKLPFDCSGGGDGHRQLTTEQQKTLDAAIDAGDCCVDDGCC